ncbi:RNA polymerase sigma factor [Lentzea sp. NPDC059081]|uniref:RNA polymerase sigma factor n=1 Tax=Lentzea sp. NPDC059081 TaxID=3346719 RepID=UPI0036D0ED6B
MSIETRPSEDEPDAHRALFELCQTKVRSYLLKNLPNPSDVDDAASEVLTRALEGLHGGAQPAELPRWVFGIARNVLKGYYEANRKFPVAADGEDVEQVPTEPPIDLPDLPDQPSELEHLLGRRQLWQTVTTAVSSIPASFQPLMRAHIDESRRHGEYVVGKRLAALTGIPVKNVDRQLARAREALPLAFAALVLARSRRDACPGLAAIVPAGRYVVLDPDQSRAVLAHAADCAGCGPHLGKYNTIGRWAIGPGLLVLPEDDDEHRGVLAALSGRDVTLRASATSAAPAPGLAERARTALMEQVARLDTPLRFVQEHPEIARRVVAGAVALVSGATLVASLLFGPDGEPDRVEGLPESGPTTTTAPGVSASTDPSGTYQDGQPVLDSNGRPQGRITRPGAAAPDGTAGTPTTTTSAGKGTDDPGEPGTPWNGEVTVDGRDSGYIAYSVSGTPGQHPTAQPVALKIQPGDHVLTSTAYTTIPFHVADDGRIEYSSAHDGLVSGRGTRTLRLRGLPVTLDATSLAYQSATVSGTGVSQTRSKTMNLFPGKHFVQTPAGDRLDFEVTRAGTVTYLPAVDPVLDGAGTSTLTVVGTPITFDVTDVDYVNMAVGGTGWPVPQDVRTLRLLPGAHTVVTPAGTSYPFRVTSAGALDYDPALEDVFDGAGGTTLAVRGVTVRVDATRSGTDYVAVDGAGWWAAGTPHDFRLLPGPHKVRLHDQRAWPFTVDRAGTVGYDPSLDPLLEGRGTGTLSFR